MRLRHKEGVIGSNPVEVASFEPNPVALPSILQVLLVVLGQILGSLRLKEGVEGSNPVESADAYV